MVTISNFREEQYPATDEMQAIVVYIPLGDEFKQLLAGLMALPCRIANYQGEDEAQVEGLADIWQQAYDVTDWGLAMQGVSSLILFGSTAVVKTGNAMQMVMDTAQRFASYWQQNTSANGDKFSWAAWLEKGTYDYRWTYQRTAGSAQVKLTVVAPEGLVENTTVDQFGTTQANTIATGAFTLSEGGECEIGMEVTGRAAGNTTAWLNRTICLELWRP